MNPNIQIFRNPAFCEIRTTLNAQGDPLFCLADVCRALDLGNPSQAKPVLTQRGAKSST